MTSSTVSDLSSELTDLLNACDDYSSFDLNAEDIALLVQHLDLVIEKNAVLNLTRITDEHEALILHILDSLLFIAHDPKLLSASTSLLDIGTGAGFPGIPLTIASGCRATLVDSVGKKVRAVQEFTEQLSISDRVSCLHARAEEVPDLCPHRFDVVTARAVAQTNVLIEYATPCLRRNGFLIVGKGNPTGEELETANSAAQICGLKRTNMFEYELLRELGHRSILVYKKVGNPRIKLPRQNGMAKKMSLGL